ncbi:MAG: D-glycero-beta-D-manno-heptose 1,7-bisphosphate 7-phosphatase [Acidaminococcaceae bacterium]|nr:D-glycero-beta-D-manno-heptose 1,7-bisphosphate 7-phosphatase [Acidaminococcaceae bacterium]MDD4721649.1 D-glycero-beta-D-manno-heptose 1,7-bisphosphate 7-phosphatase [Acidaminococcaceae bacterium]
MKHKAVFLDRDGVLNVDNGYLFKIADIQWIAGAKEAVGYLTKLGYKIFVVTNQSGIARGYYDHKDVHLLHDYMNSEFAKVGGKVNKFYYCPHHPTKGTIPEYTCTCNCRKPNPGMLLQAIEEYDVDCAQSFLVGDKETDLAAANAAGVTGYLFTGGNLLTFVQNIIGQG